jgi:hypothetical protein
MNDSIINASHSWHGVGGEEANSMKVVIDQTLVAVILQAEYM